MKRLGDEHLVPQITYQLGREEMRQEVMAALAAASASNKTKDGKDALDRAVQVVSSIGQRGS